MEFYGSLVCSCIFYKQLATGHHDVTPPRNTGVVWHSFRTWITFAHEVGHNFGGVLGEEQKSCGFRMRSWNEPLLFV